MCTMQLQSCRNTARGDASTSLTLDSRTRRTLDKALDEGFAASGMPTANRLPPGKAAEGNPECIPGF
jgi:hypothetical protein